MTTRFVFPYLTFPYHLLLKSSTYTHEKVTGTSSPAESFGTSPPLSSLPTWNDGSTFTDVNFTEPSIPTPNTTGFTPDGALQTEDSFIEAEFVGFLEEVNFEGISASDVSGLTGIPPLLLQFLAPPDPVGDVSETQYVQMVNFAIAVYDKTGVLLQAPVSLATFWAAAGLPGCALNYGQPIVLYDQFNKRWIMMTSGAFPFSICLAVSTTDDATETYNLYRVPIGVFPANPKMGIWRDKLVITSTDFSLGPITYQGVGVTVVNLDQLVAGDPPPAVQGRRFFLPAILNALFPSIIGDGLLPPDVDGTVEPDELSAIPLLGTQDFDAGADFDGINIWDLVVNWANPGAASLTYVQTLPVAAFDSIFNLCGGTRNCLPQPGVAQQIDILSYRQRPLHRLAYRNFGTHESLVTNQAVEARTDIAGIRWYEIRRQPVNGPYLIQEQGTYSPDDTHRWMGSIAQDKNGNTALGYSVTSDDVFPGIRYTGRRPGDPGGQMTIEEEILIAGSGSQSFSFRWGRYTSMNVDPVDDCTFWYVNEYYQTTGPNWQTRIASFRLDDCILSQEPSAAPSQQPSAAPSQQPSASPSQQPSAAPSAFRPAPTNSYFCFSGENSVEVQGKGLVSIDSLKIGDWVRVRGDDKYAQVYSLSHWNKHQEADFFQITAKSTTAEMTIEATADHLLYALNGSTLKTIPASDIKVGDLLVAADGTPAPVIHIDTVKRSGIYAPFTTTGEIVVSGVVASNYANIYNEENVGFPISFHWMAHAYKGIHRMACSVNFDWCNNEAYTDDGISDRNPQWLTQSYAWFGQQSTGIQILMLSLVFPVLLMVSIMENMFQSAAILSILLAGFALAHAKKMHKACKVKLA